MNYDIIVIGGGHAGCEAANAAGRIGCKVLLINLDMTKFAQMSCNPAMGGIAKGQIIREIDALGGISGIVTDKSMIQFRMLNKSKGPAMWSPRAQCDRSEFSIFWKQEIEKNRNIDLLQDAVNELLIKKNTIIGVKTKIGIIFYSKCVILTNGTFENGKIYIGRSTFNGGRINECWSEGISKQLEYLGFEVGRMKTGTPARIDGRSINWKDLIEQKGDEAGGKFSFLTKNNIITNQSCFIAYTNRKVHDILKKGFKDSPLFSGSIKGIGPRYCPSIETKIITFHNKTEHQLFIEPEGRNTNEYYINGFSSSLSWEIQYEALRNIKGLEKVIMHRPGYAIEYDYYPPTQLKHTLETKNIENLFFAGQINGTTGYEEAAGQGIIAGINASMKCLKENEFILKRNEAYIGVLIDDLVTKSVDEPYRMFTSRAEYRILLRQDNCDERLTEKSFLIGLADKNRMKKTKEKIEKKERLKNILKNISIEPNEINEFLKERKNSKIKQKVKSIEIAKRNDIKLVDFFNEIIRNKVSEDKKNMFNNEVLESVEIELKYKGYISREEGIAKKMERLEKIEIYKNIDYSKISSLSTEARQKLIKVKPKTIGQASRISGVSPSDINVILVHIGR